MEKADNQDDSDECTPGLIHESGRTSRRNCYTAALLKIRRSSMQQIDKEIKPKNLKQAKQVKDVAFDLTFKSLFDGEILPPEYLFRDPNCQSMTFEEWNTTFQPQLRNRSTQTIRKTKQPICNSNNQNISFTPMPISSSSSSISQNGFELPCRCSTPCFHPVYKLKKPSV